MRALLFFICFLGGYFHQDTRRETEQAEKVRTEVRVIEDFKLTQHSLKGPAGR